MRFSRRLSIQGAVGSNVIREAAKQTHLWSEWEDNMHKAWTECIWRIEDEIFLKKYTRKPLNGERIWEDLMRRWADILFTEIWSSYASRNLTVWHWSGIADFISGGDLKTRPI